MKWSGSIKYIIRITRILYLLLHYIYLIAAVTSYCAHHVIWQYLHVVVLE